MQDDNMFDAIVIIVLIVCALFVACLAGFTIGRDAGAIAHYKGEARVVENPIVPGEYLVDFSQVDFCTAPETKGKP